MATQVEAVVLARKKFEPRAEVKLPDLFTQAKEKLGYAPSAIVDRDVYEKRRTQEVEVARGLGSLGIEPLDKASVDAYKQQQVERIIRRGSSRFVHYMHTVKGENVVFLLGLAGTFSLVVLLVSLVSTADPGKPVPPKEFFLVPFRCWFALFATWGALMYARHKKAITYSASWKGEWLETYRQPVPEFALERALQVKEALPTARFFVQTLVEQAHGVHTETTSQLPDPFLVLAYGDVRVYLDVWDEPKFEGRRTV